METISAQTDLDLALKAKEEANKLYDSNNYGEARCLYNECLKHAQRVRDRNRQQKSGEKDPQDDASAGRGLDINEGVNENRSMIEEANDLIAKTSNNLAACILKDTKSGSSDFSLAVQYCDDVLARDKTNEEALLRKGVCLARMLQYRDAVDVLKQCKISNMDAQVQIVCCQKEQTGKNKDLISSLPLEKKRKTSLYKAIDAMDHYDPSWRAYLSTKTDETLCIPDCLDLGKGRLTRAVDENASGFVKHSDPTLNRARETDTTGNKGEDKFLSDFQGLGVGGILLHGFNSKTFFGKMKCQMNEEINDQKPDFLFFHEQIGILVIEIKGGDEREHSETKGKIGALDSKRKRGENQIEKRQKAMPEVIQTILKSELKFALHYAIGLPYSNLLQDDTSNSTHIIDQSMLENPTVFKKKLNEFYNNSKTLHGDELMVFQTQVAALIYGSKTMVELSHALSAMALSRPIDEESYLLEKLPKDQKIVKVNLAYESRDKTTFLFNDDQAAAIDYHSNPENVNKRIQIVTGVPGTGKTLIWQVQALKNTKAVRKKGTRIVIVVTDDLKPSMQLFFLLNKDEETKTDPTWISPRQYVEDQFTRIQDDDDLYMDETTLNGNLLQRVLEERKKSNGRTTVVITGFQMPTHVKKVSDRLKEFLKEEEYSVNTLRTAVRGTHHIMKKWIKKFPGIKTYFGHKYTGSKVRKLKYLQDNEILEAIWQEVQFYTEELKDIHLDPKRVFIWKPSHVVIIAENEDSAQKIREFLNNKKITSCGINFNSDTAIESFRDPNALLKPSTSRITVCNALETPSQQWPVVIQVCFGRTELHEFHCLLARSRALAKLTTIKRDFRQVQQEIDDEFLRDPAIPYEKLANNIGTLVKRRLLDETLTHSTIMATIIRHNYIDPSIKEIAGFEHCNTLMNAFEVLDKSNLLRTIAAKYANERNANELTMKEYLHEFKIGMWKLSRDKVPLFLHIYWNRSKISTPVNGGTDEKTRWNTIYSILSQLIEMNSPSLSLEEDDDSELENNCGIWIVVNTILFILDACFGAIIE